MVMMKGLVLVLLVSSTCIYAVPDLFMNRDLLSVRTADFEGNLVFLQALWRHGDRTPTQQFPSDTNEWPEGHGQLTVTGMMDQLKLGEKLRERYINTVPFLSKRYVSNEIYVRSTDVNRTLISAISNMIGFYKESSEPNKDYPENKEWPAGFVPVPVHTEDFRHDYVGNVDRQCPRTKALYTLFKKSPQYKKLLEDNKEFLANLTQLANMTVTLDNLYVLDDDLFIIRKKNATRPPGFTDEICDQVRELSNELDKTIFGIGLEPHEDVDLSTELAKIKGGPLLWSFIDRMEQKILCLTKDESKRSKEEKGICRWIEPMKYHILSAHDTTLAGLFSSFGFNESNYHAPGLPDYASAVTVELREKDKKYFVKVLFWPPKDGENFQDITPEVRGCDENCEFDKFVKRSEPYKVDDPNSFCQDDKLTKSATITTVSSIIMLVSSIFWLFY